MSLYKPSDLTCVILAGGKGSRLSEETTSRPKPLVEVGGRPILWHIMRIYTSFGVTKFVICLGYMGFKIKEYFANYYLHESDVTIQMGGETVYHAIQAQPWSVTLIDTGEDTMTGGRLKRIGQYLPKDRPFFATYGDGVGDIDIAGLLATHQAGGVKATVTATRPLARFGALELDGQKVLAFKEKPVAEGGYINGGFFVLEPECLDLVQDDSTIWEQGPLETLASEGQLQAFFHDGFWQPMDTLRDKMHLNELWAKEEAPWKSW